MAQAAAGSSSSGDSSLQELRNLLEDVQFVQFLPRLRDDLQVIGQKVKKFFFCVLLNYVKMLRNGTLVSIICMRLPKLRVRSLTTENNYGTLQPKYGALNQQVDILDISNLEPKYGTLDQHIGYTFEAPLEVKSLRNEHSREYMLVKAYREFGHLFADVNPLETPKTHLLKALEVSEYGLSEEDQCPVHILSCWENSSNSTSEISVRELVQRLQAAYCGGITAQFTHLLDSSEREWFTSQFENDDLHQPINSDQKVRICKLLLESQCFDKFLEIRFPSFKRYGLEGSEALLVLHDQIFREAAYQDLRQVFVSATHRGRSNFLSGLLNVSPEAYFNKLKGGKEFSEDFQYTGDVVYNLATETKLLHDSKEITITVHKNPAHLESSTPVSMGRTRAYLRKNQEGQYGTNPSTAINLAIHGDAGVVGQGVVTESLQMSKLPHFNVGGTLHVIVNNQVGFTNPARLGRSSRYASDVALLIGAPVIRVNAACPELVVKAASIAMSYRQTFQKDIFIDTLGWRRHGHNEMDNPRFTSPAMYRIIDNLPTVPDLYASQLVSAGVLTNQEVQSITTKRKNYLQRCYEESHEYKCDPAAVLAKWDGLVQDSGGVSSSCDTGVDEDTLVNMAKCSVHTPPNFNINDHIKKVHVKKRLKRLSEGGPIDWATAEAMAFGSLLQQGFGVRLCGQDVERGTFSHRHCVLIDQQTEQSYVPLNNISEQQTAYLEATNSILSEEAVLGFEFGLSLNNKDTLHIWEAQFGDFFNGAQIIIDTYVASSETKWLDQSGLVMVLPHGSDNGGPDHSSCRLERFLNDCSSNDAETDSTFNWTVAVPSTPAQYFHLLRQQMLRPYRKPLIVAGPKSILRLPAASSTLKDMSPGTHFKPLIDDHSIRNPEYVRRVVFTSGKHYYTLAEERDRRGVTDMVLVRLESLFPFPAKDIQDVIRKYHGANKYIWAQEEPRNMGAWSFLFPRFLNICGIKVDYSGRSPSSAPAVGEESLHLKEVQNNFQMTFQ